MAIAKIFWAGPAILLEDFLGCLQEVNLQAAVANENGTMVVVGENEEAAVERLLLETFDDHLSILEAELHVPDDWSQPGFVLQVARLRPNASLIMTSGRGVLTVA